MKGITKYIGSCIKHEALNARPRKPTGPVIVMATYQTKIMHIKR